MSPPRRRLSTWTAPGRRETIFVLCLFTIIVFIFQSNVSADYSDEDDSSSSWSWRAAYSNSDYWFSRGSSASSNAGSSKKLKSDGSNIIPSIQGSDNSGLTINDVTISWKGPKEKMPQTTIVQHTEGFTILDNIYAHNGTLYIITDSPKSVPQIRTMISSGYPVFNGEAEVKKREPTAKDMQIITVKEAEKMFGKLAHRLEGVTFMSNDPPQSAELFFGLWRAYSSLDPSIKSTGQTVLPPPRRWIFTHTREDKWRDYAKMNQWIMHAAFPSASLEFSTDWKDRAGTQRLWFFDRLVLADRAAAMRGGPFVATERYASAAFELPGSAMWFEPVRTNVVEFAGLHRSEGSGTMHKPVITYVNRQDWGRRMLKPEDHEGLVRALRRLEKERGWEVNIVAMDKLTREEQFQLAGRTTIMMGVHGNGLTSLLWMHPTPRAAVMEFFYPGGFAEDYEWTARALGITHYGFWGGQHFSSPDLPPRAYPEGFQGNEIPIDGEAVANLVIHQLSLNEEADD
ncbi:hypothetical protein FRC00_003623 [Tulasnella sp. 408]|nr:hypothetical protein FRC00_003623 [Tulasnella sp. 408]